MKNGFHKAIGKGWVIAWLNFIVFMLLLPAVSMAETLVSGLISENTTWTVGGGPYIITGDVTVRHALPGEENTATLSIEPGVTVRFRPGTRLAIGYSSSYHGALVARGTVEAPIVFTSDVATPAPGDWKGLYFDTATDDNNTILEHCLVEYAGQSYNANIYCLNASPTIKNCTIRTSSGHGIYLNGSSNPPIGGEGTGNTITGNAAYGIHAANTTPAPVITHNTISSNGDYPIRIGPGKTIHGNTFSGNSRQGIELMGGTILADTSWTNQGVPYIITGSITVRHATSSTDQAAILTIDPGVTVKFRPGTRLAFGYSSNYLGALVARGTAEAPVIFTSDAATPAPGDWMGLYFDNATDDNATVLEHCLVEYAGQSYNANIYCLNASPTIKSCTIRTSSGHGIYLNGASNPPIGGEGTGNTITGNAAYGIHAANATPAPVITHNTISANGDYPIRIGPGKTIHGNSFSGNSRQGIELMGGTILADTSWTNQGAPYIVTGSITVRHATSSADQAAILTIDPGVTVKFRPNTRLAFGYSTNYLGALEARGTAEAPIVFTSDAATPAPGDWMGLYFDNGTDDDTTSLKHCVIEYGGQAYNANIHCNNASPLIMDSSIRYSRHSGLYLNGTGCNNATILFNTFQHSKYGVYLASNALPPLQNNNFMNHSLYGVYNAGNMTVTADNNWWGTPQGPNTSGDQTYGPLDAEPWLTQSVNGISIGDCDGDGLSDAWEFSWFGNLTLGDLDDPDNDGIPNYLEYQGETSPTHPDQKSVTTLDFSHNAGGRIRNMIVNP